MNNPLLQDWTTRFELAPFDAIEDVHFEPAFETALAEAQAEIGAIAANPEAPSFANTIEALEVAGKRLDQVLSVFYSVSGADTNDTRQALQRSFSPKLAAHSSEIFGNKALFARIESLWQDHEALELTDEQSRVLMLTHRSFRRAGAGLTGEDDARMREIRKRLAELGTAFTQNLLADEAGWFMELSEDDLEGLPDFVISAAREAGREKGAGCPVVTLSRSLIVPFLQFSPRRDLRQKAFAAWAARGANGGDTDNRAITAEILALREERAKLLGYDSFAAFKLETEMAKTPDAVRGLLMDVWTPAKARAEADAAVLTEMMQADGFNAPLEPWDWR
ncbi:MAG: M3 family metallopeptidase, partial [Pseudomonadota bacterium]